MIYTDNFRKSEHYFSIVRWLIFIGVVFLVYFSTYLDYLKTHEDLFLYFIGFAFIYTVVIQIILWIKPLFHQYYRVFALISIGMDLVAILWLIFITGGVNSLFAPFLLLVIIPRTHLLASRWLHNHICIHLHRVHRYMGFSRTIYRRMAFMGIWFLYDFSLISGYFVIHRYKTTET